MTPDERAGPERGEAAPTTSGGHDYLSTACHHGEHHYCQADETGDGRPKTQAAQALAVLNLPPNPSRTSPTVNGKAVKATR